ncbi:Cytochrome P450 301b1 [Gryllus bimaculatus]|nr:Cytochrome P450 301b1 [Gryllus bimaculatus]
MLEVHHTLRSTYGDIVRLSGMPKNRDMVALYDPVDIEKVYRNEGAWPKREAFGSLNYYRRFINKERYEGSHGLLTTSSGAACKGPCCSLAPSRSTPPPSTQWLRICGRFEMKMVSYQRMLTTGSSDGHWNVAGEPQKMIDAVQVLFEGMFELDIKPSIWKYISTPMWRKYVNAISTFETVSEKYIQNRVNRLKSKMAEGGDIGDDLSVLERLLLANDNPRIAMTMALDMLFAGIDTTSYATGALLYLLSRNPDKQEELHAELRRVLPQRDTPVTAERLQDMKYLRAAIKESMRMKPVAIGQLRENPKEGLVLRNYYIPKGVSNEIKLDK